MTQQWQSLASDPWPGTSDHPFPSSELVIPPPFSVKSPWLQEQEMDVTIRQNLKIASLRSVAAYQDRSVSSQRTRTGKKNVLRRAGARRLGDEYFPIGGTSGTTEGHNSILGS